MDPKVQSRLEKDSEVYITTYEPQGKFGTVPVWFIPLGGKVYIYTEVKTIKARRIGENPRVKLSFGGKAGPSMEGEACLSKDKGTVELAVSAMSGKYGKSLDQWFGGSKKMLARLLETRESIMLEITPR